MPVRYPHLLRAVLAQPWAIDPTSLAWAAVLDVLALRAAGEYLSEAEIAARIEAASNGPRGGGQRAGGVAVLPLYGVISPRANMLSSTSGGTTAEDFGNNLAAALADPNVAGIVIDIDSPGGAVSGIDEVAAQVRAARAQKPIVAVANHLAASAAYWIASGASELVATPSGAVGSIGIIGAHDDMTKALEAEGITRTVISAGKYKADGALGQALSAEGVAHMQAEADTFYGMFTGAVAKGRGVSVDTVRNGYGQGRVVLARAALAEGMIDRVDTLDATIRRVAAGQVPVRPAPTAPASADATERRLAAVAERAALPPITVHEAVGGRELADDPGDPSTTDDDEPTPGPAASDDRVVPGSRARRILRQAALEGGHAID